MKGFCLFALAVVGFSGCASLRSPTPGLFYTDTKNALIATSSASGTRVGEACSYSYLGLVGAGDASIETARRNGGITTITSVDESSMSVLFFYGKYCVMVRGR